MARVPLYFVADGVLAAHRDRGDSTDGGSSVEDMMMNMRSMHLAWVGVLLAVVGNLFIAGGFVLQKMVHNAEAAARKEASGDPPSGKAADQAPPASPPSSEVSSSAAHDSNELDVATKATDPTVLTESHDAMSDKVFYLRRGRWWLGLIFIGVGEACNLFAYGFASGSIVPPLGAIALVAIAFLSWLLLHERLSLLNWASLALCVVGVVLVGVYGLRSPLSEAALSARQILTLLRQPALYGMAIIVGALWLALFLAVIFRPEVGKKWVLVYAALAGIAAAVKSRTFKASMQMLWHSVREGGRSFGTWTFWIMIVVALVTVVLGIYYINQGQYHFQQSVFVPLYFCIFTVLSVLSSLVMYREYENQSTSRLVGFSVGIVLVLGGVLGLSVPGDLQFRCKVGRQPTASEANA